MRASIGTPLTRIDGRVKVTGAARYPSDESVSSPAYACLVTSAIACGKIVRFKLDAARSVAGVLDILTYENVGQLAKPPGSPGGRGANTTSLESARIWHDGQIIAIVVADSFEAAREGAHRVEVDYEAQPAAATFGDRTATTQAVSEIKPDQPEPAVGNARAAYASAPVKIDARYSTPTQHHNPLELFTTTCLWAGDQLTILESSQYVHGLSNGVAKQLGIEPDRVTVISRYTGGAFGSRGEVTHRTAWIAIAARRLNRPVKLVATRDQGFTIVTYRAETQHHVQLAASFDGNLQALIHEGWEISSRPSPYNVSGTETTARIYRCPNVETKVSVVHADRNTPGFMRAPPDTPYMFALESAMDELAAKLGIDPVALRRINDTQNEPIKGLPYTSRSLIQCYDAASKAFDWPRREPQPRSMRDGEWLIGLGCATAAYPSNIGAATTRIIVSSQGKVRVEMGAHEIGNGVYTMIALLVSDRLGVEVSNIDVRIGDSRFPVAGLAAGSMHAASVSNVVVKACDQIRAQVAKAAHGPHEPIGETVARIGGAIEAYVENIPNGVPPNGAQMLYHGQLAIARGGGLKDRIAYAFGAQFVEVRVHSRTCEVRVPRAVGAFAGGTIINPMAARSQLMGGMIWGISSALLEATEMDHRLARYNNDNLADYLVPVNADIGEIEVIIVPEKDSGVNPLGVKGIGEIGIVGMNAAIANAVYHATGTRVRDLPIRIESLLSSSA